jgi:hypothetical protein
MIYEEASSERESTTRWDVGKMWERKRGNLIATASTSIRSTTTRLLEAVATSGHPATATSPSAAVETGDVCAFGGNLVRIRDTTSMR